MRQRTTSRRTLLMGSAALSAAMLTPAAARVAAQGDGTGGAGDYLLPANRILSYYGFPTNELMGILGEYSKEDLLPILREQAAAYAAADPSRPVKLAYEVIASVAQRDAGADGNYLEYTDPGWIQEYVDFTAANDLLLILDMQYGYNTTEQELNAVREYLLYPHVHLALDPEFSVNDGEVPGERPRTMHVLSEIARATARHEKAQRAERAGPRMKKKGAWCHFGPAMCRGASKAHGIFEIASLPRPRSISGALEGSADIAEQNP